MNFLDTANKRASLAVAHEETHKENKTIPGLLSPPKVSAILVIIMDPTALTHGRQQPIKTQGEKKQLF